MLDKLKWFFAASALVCFVWYLVIDRPTGYNMYGHTYFKWGHYFLFMLLGAMIGISQREWKYNFRIDILKLVGSVAVYYGVLYAGRKVLLINEWQIFSLVPLLLIVFYLYKICNSAALKDCYEHRITGWCIKFIGGLCLEIYLIQGALFTDKMNDIFPLNIPIMFIIIFIAAYILRCGARLFAQTFKEQEYDWKAIIKPV